MTTTTTTTTPLTFDDWFALTQLYADYSSAVDSGHWNLWPEFFTDDCVYRLQPRENHERGCRPRSRSRARGC
jgi:salicylate 5-hydroxylase small subunit